MTFQESYIRGFATTLGVFAAVSVIIAFIDISDKAFDRIG